MPDYQTRYCAFVDILGFRELVRANMDSDGVQRLRSMLESVHQPPLSGEQLFEGSDLRVESISDGVWVSAASSQGGLNHLVHSLEGLAMGLLDNGILIRGGVVKAPLCHDEHVVFEPALS
jgi:hypothetical protein